MAISAGRRRRLVRGRWIRTAVSLAFGAFGVGFILMLAQALRPNLVLYLVAFVVMAGIPFVIIGILNRVAADEMPRPDMDTLFNIAGLLVTSAGFNLIPVWKWVDAARQTADGWLQVPLPEPDFSLPNLFFTCLALVLSVVALFRGLSSPQQKLAQAQATIGYLKQARTDLLKVIRRTNDSPGLRSLQAELSKRKFAMNPEEKHEQLHRILTGYLARLRRRGGVSASTGRKA
jgi:hypothetical protein